MRVNPIGEKFRSKTNLNMCTASDGCAPARYTEPYLSELKISSAKMEASCCHQVEKGHTNLLEICPVKQGAAVTWTALTGRGVRCGESQWHFPHKPPNGGEPTMRKGSYSKELVRHQARFASDLCRIVW